MILHVSPLNLKRGTFGLPSNPKTGEGYQGESITVRLISYFTGLDLSMQANLLFICTWQSDRIQTGKTGGQQYSDTSLCHHSQLNWHAAFDLYVLIKWHLTL